MAGVIHYYWLVKADHRLPLTYAAILAVLLAYRNWEMGEAETASGAKLPLRLEMHNCSAEHVDTPSQDYFGKAKKQPLPRYSDLQA